MDYNTRIRIAKDFADELSGEEWIRVVFITGSTVDKGFRPDSDIDIGIITKEYCEGDFEDCKIRKTRTKKKYNMIDDELCSFCETGNGLIEGIKEYFESGYIKPFYDLTNRTLVLYEEERGVYENFRRKLIQECRNF